MDNQARTNLQKWRRRMRVRNAIRGNSTRPRLSVFRSSMHIYAQIIDDERGITLASASTKAPPVCDIVKYGGNVRAAIEVGKQIAEAAKAVGITQVAFDRGHYRYHGRVKALADAARSGGLQF
jgi:large subunit ribosomal protein L18